MRLTGVIKTSIVLPLVAAVLASCAVGLWNARSEFTSVQSFISTAASMSKAIPHFQRASELDPSLPKPILYLGRCYVRAWAGT